MSDGARIARLREVAREVMIECEAALLDAADALTRLQQERDLYQRQLEKVDETLGFPTLEGFGRVEMIQQAQATVDRLTAALREIEKACVEQTVAGANHRLLLQIRFKAGAALSPEPEVMRAALAPADPEPRKIRAEMGLSENLIIAPADPELKETK